MYIFEYNKTSENVTDEFADEVIEQIQSKSKSEFIIIGKDFVLPISAIKLLKKLDEDIASDEEWQTNRPPMPGSEQDGKSTHNGVAIPDDLKLDI
jgi:hypothetical protein